MQSVKSVAGIVNIGSIEVIYVKLWSCDAFGVDWEAHDYLVAETEDEAREKFYTVIEEGNGWCAGVHAREAIGIDGYKVVSVTDKQIILSK